MDTLNAVPDTFNKFSDKLPNIDMDIIETIPKPTSILMNGWTILTIILILGLIGFNVFTYLIKGTDMFGNTIKSFADMFTFGATNTIVASEKGTEVLNKEIQKNTKEVGKGVNRTIDNASTGSKKTVDVVANTTKSGVNLITGNGSANLYEQSIEHVNKLTTTNHRDLRYDYSLNDRARIPVEEDNGSLVQKRHEKGEFCYIGSDRGYRSCVQLNEDDICMSGDIFPTKDVCINPSLRY
jgi:hypothetical protein